MNFLLEIVTEEIPHWMIPGALEQLSRLELGAVPVVDATPRRLVVQASGLPQRTPDREEIVKGPPVSAGEKAAAGFARKQGVDPAEVKAMGAYYELRKRVPGRNTVDILAEALPSAILGTASMQVSDLLKLGRGAVVELDRKIGDAIDIYVNNRLVARGEVVVVDDQLGVTMTEIIKTERN